jgi:hypothetical protein
MFPDFCLPQEAIIGNAKGIGKAFSIRNEEWKIDDIFLVGNKEEISV